MNKIVSKVSFVTGIFLLPVLLFTLNCVVHQDRVSLDGKRGEILSLIFLSGTKYSSDYSHEKFKQIRMGMSETEVVSMLGTPLYKWQPYGANLPLKRHYAGYGYSLSADSGSYRIRQINFDRGTVAEIINYFYID